LVGVRPRCAVDVVLAARCHVVVVVKLRDYRAEAVVDVPAGNASGRTQYTGQRFPAIRRQTAIGHDYMYPASLYAWYTSESFSGSSPMPSAGSSIGG
jgi:hypothetical protein